MQKLPVLPTTLPLVTASVALPLLWFNVLQVRLLTRLVKTLGRQAEQGSEFREDSG